MPVHAIAHHLMSVVELNDSLGFQFASDCIDHRNGKDMSNVLIATEARLLAELSLTVLGDVVEKLAVGEVPGGTSHPELGTPAPLPPSH